MRSDQWMCFTPAAAAHTFFFFFHKHRHAVTHRQVLHHPQQPVTGDTAHYLLITSPFFCNTGADRSTVMDSFFQTAVQRSQWKPPRSQGQSDDVPNRGFNSAHHHGDAPIRDGSRSCSPHTLCLCVPLSSCPSVCLFHSFLSSTSRF